VTRLGPWLFLAIVAAGAFLAGRWSVVPDDQELRDSLAVWREHRKQDAAALDSSRRVIVAARELAATQEAEATKWRSIAAARVVVADRERARADGFARQLAEATTPEDSLKACIAEVTARRSECAEVRATNGALLEAAAADSAAKDVLRTENAAHLGQRGLDSTRLAESDGLIVRLEKAAGGCRVPLLAFPCPIPLAGYNVTLRKVEGGAIVPFKLGRFRVGASVTWSP
jgi:hypothetical protein